MSRHERRAAATDTAGELTTAEIERLSEVAEASGCDRCRSRIVTLISGLADLAALSKAEREQMYRERIAARLAALEPALAP